VAKLGFDRLLQPGVVLRWAWGVEINLIRNWAAIQRLHATWPTRLTIGFAALAGHVSGSRALSAELLDEIVDRAKACRCSWRSPSASGFTISSSFLLMSSVPKLETAWWWTAWRSDQNWVRIRDRDARQADQTRHHVQQRIGVDGSRHREFGRLT